MTDDWLVQRCMEGKDAYWSVLYRRYHPRLIEKMVNNGAALGDAEESADEYLLVARRLLATYLYAVGKQTTFLEWLVQLTPQVARKKHME